MDIVRAIAAGHGRPPAQVALAWLLGKPGVSAPVIGATRLAHLAEAVAAVGITLSEDTVAQLEKPYRPHRILGH